MSSAHPTEAEENLASQLSEEDDETPSLAELNNQFFHGETPREPPPTPSYRERVLPLDLILACKEDYMKTRCEPDDFENARIVLDDERGVRVMAEELTRDGQIHPIGVIERQGFQEHERVTFYGLRSGFRRVRAARSLGWKEIKAIIVPPDMTVLEQHFFHIAENSFRKDLSPYEMAARGAYLIEKFKITPRLYAQRTGKSYSYINNLLRYYRELPEEILDDWKKDHRLLTRAWMDRLVVMEPSEAIQQWGVYSGQLPGQKKPDALRPHIPGVKVPHRRASERNLLRLRLVLEQKKSQMPAQVWKLAIQIVDFALGAQRRIPGLPLRLKDGLRVPVGRPLKSAAETQAKIVELKRSKQKPPTNETKGPTP